MNKREREEATFTKFCRKYSSKGVLFLGLSTGYIRLP